MTLLGSLVFLNALFALCVARHSVDFNRTLVGNLQRIDNKVSSVLAWFGLLNAIPLLEAASVMYGRLAIISFIMMFFSKYFLEVDILSFDVFGVLFFLSLMMWFSIFVFRKPSISISAVLGNVVKIVPIVSIIIFILYITEQPNSPPLSDGTFGPIFRIFEVLGIHLDTRTSEIISLCVFFLVCLAVLFITQILILIPFFILGALLAVVMRYAANLALWLTPGRPLTFICIFGFVSSAAAMAYLS